MVIGESSLNFDRSSTAGVLEKRFQCFTRMNIAGKLFISERTVNKHMQNIFKKAESRNKFDLLNKITRDVRSA